jgi:hypothetical protein
MIFSRLKDKEFVKGIYFLSIFLVSLPPIFLGFSFLNTHSLAKAIFAGLFAIYLFGFQKISLPEKENTFLYLFLALFGIQSISIIGASNSLAFLAQYEDLVFSAFFVLVSLFIIDSLSDIKNVLYIFLLSGIINIFLQAFLVVEPNGFLNIAKNFLHQDYLELIKLNLERKRIYLEIYDEILIPLAVYVFIKAKKIKTKTTSFVFAISLIVFSFISNFRTRFLMLAVSLAGSFLVFIREAGKKLIIGTGIVGIIFLLLYTLMVKATGFSVVERIFLEDRVEDVETVTQRFGAWEVSTQMGFSSPIFGVGLGNYYDHIPSSKKHIFSVFERKQKEFEFAAYYPHNLFFKTLAENGVLGAIIFVLLLIYFAKKDYDILLNKPVFPKVLVISFWSLFTHVMFNPAITIKIYMTYWILRILIEKVDGLKKEPSFNL